MADREGVRKAWLSRLGTLQVDDALLPDERSFLERPVGELQEGDLDDLEGRASGTLVFLWALGRLPARPSFAAVAEMETVIATHGLLGDGSISKANEAAERASLLSEDELRSALSAYEKLRGKAKEPSEPEKIVAMIAAHHLAWIVDPDAAFA